MSWHHKTPGQNKVDLHRTNHRGHGYSVELTNYKRRALYPTFYRDTAMLENVIFCGVRALFLRRMVPRGRCGVE